MYTPFTRFASCACFLLIAGIVLLSLSSPSHAQGDSSLPPVLFVTSGRVRELEWINDREVQNVPFETPQPVVSFDWEKQIELRQVAGGASSNYSGRLFGTAWMKVSGSNGKLITSQSIEHGYEHFAGWPFFLTSLRCDSQSLFYIRGGYGTLYSWKASAESSFVPGATQTQSGNNIGWQSTLVGYGSTFSWHEFTPNRVASGVDRTQEGYGPPIYYQGQIYTPTVPKSALTVSTGFGSTGPSYPYTVWAGKGTYTYTIEMTREEGNSRLNKPGDDDRGPYQCFGDNKVNLSTGNAHYTLPDPVSTRGYPLTNNLHFSTQNIENNRPLGNATFTYDIHIAQQDVKTSGGVSVKNWVVVDGDGTRSLFGPVTAAPTPEPGVFSALQQTPTGFLLKNAGPPEHIERAGNFSYTFNTAGRLLSVRDPDGNLQTLDYDDAGLLTRILDVSSQKEITFLRSEGRLTRIVENAGGAVTNLSYTGGKLTRVTISGASGTLLRDDEFRYNDAGLLTHIIKSAGPTVETRISYTFAASAEGAAAAKIPMANLSIPAGPSTSIDWLASPADGFANRVAQSKASGQSVFYDYDEKLNLRRVIYPVFTGASSSTIYQFTYDANRNRISATNGASFWNMKYAPNGLLTRFSDSTGGIWNYNYQDADLLSVTDPQGTLSSLGYSDSRLPHRPTSWTDEEGVTTTAAYNTFGQTLLLTPPSGSPLRATALVYDEDPLSSEYGWVRQVTNGAGNVTRFDSYTPLGDIASITTSSAPGTFSTSLLAYDALHRETGRQHADGNQTRSEYNGQYVQRDLDENGLISDWLFCVCGKPLRVDKGNGWRLNWTLNRDFQLTEFQDARRFKTNYAYGAAGELAQVTYPDASTVAYRYDNAGRVRQEINGRGQAKNITYDQSGRVETYTFPTTSLPGMVYNYYADGRPRQMQDGVGTTRYTYWPSRRVKSVEYHYQVSGLPSMQRLEYVYYPDGSLSTLTWLNGASVAGVWNYGYDGAGRMTSMSNSFGETTRYAYDGEGKLKSQSNANGTTTAYSYNKARGWPTQITQRALGNTFASYALTYDDGANTVGNLTGVTEADGSTAAYTYDFLYRLTSEGRVGENEYTRTFGYDNAGNVEQVNGIAFGTYDGANKLTVLAGGKTTHDGDGNLTSVQGAGLALGRFFWDDRSKLLRQSQGLRTVAYACDGMGKRVMSQVGTGTKTFYIFNGDLLLGEVQNGVASAAYTWGADGLVSERIGGQQGKSLWYHYGPQGETRQLTDVTGGVLDTYSYSAYGVPLTTSGSDPNPFRYGGKYGYYSDGGPMGAILCGARWYSPQLMRWVSRDPVGYRGGDNLYAYVADNPLKWVDPLGTQSQCMDCSMVSPMLSTSPNPYKPGQEYMGVDADLMFSFGGDGPWGNIVRGCLVCMLDQGAGMQDAHMLCYKTGFERTSWPDGLLGLSRAVAAATVISVGKGASSIQK